MRKEDNKAYMNFLKFFNGTASDEESKRLIKWLEADKNNRLKYFKEKRIVLESAVRQSDDEIIEQLWSRLKYRLFGPERTKAFSPSRNKADWKVYASAASLALLLAFSLYWGLKIDAFNKYSQKVNHIVVPFGSRTNIVLPDSSKVWLNSGSELTYNVGFIRNKREVVLSGEAFFDVRKMNNKSFIVNTGDLKISVLGTQFNVKSYPDENTIETVLIEGKVVIDGRDDDKSFEPVTLKPNQKMTYVKKGTPSSISEKTAKDIIAKQKTVTEEEAQQSQIDIASVTHPETDISWKEEKLVIRSESLVSLARKLERYYNVEIVFQDDKIKDYKFSGTLDEVTIDEVMRAIASTAPVSFTVDKNKVTLCSVN